MPTPQIPEAVRRVFTESFSARDVAEALASFDAGTTSRDVRDFMNAQDFDVVGIRNAGQVVGYVERASLADGECGDYMRQLDEVTILEDTAPLLKVLTALSGAPFLFLTVLGSVGGIITPADMQKAAVRMWLFGIVTLIEMRFAQLIDGHCPADSWRQYLSEGRLQKAEALLAERRRRNHSLRLFECLQFSDKGQIIAKNEEVRKLTVFTSRRQAEEAVARLEQLRNNLAHAQDIPASDWDIIVQLCAFLTQ